MLIPSGDSCTDSKHSLWVLELPHIDERMTRYNHIVSTHQHKLRIHFDHLTIDDGPETVVNGDAVLKNRELVFIVLKREK